MRKIIPFLILLATLPGCSVFMAATPSDEPQMHRIQHGTSRVQVEQVLGRPISFMRTSNGATADYQYFTGDKANYRRAATYAVLDGLTLGIAELITFPVEALQGDRHLVTVIYDRFNRVRKMASTSHQAPLAPLETILGIEEYLPPEA